jgi:Collagen triple helix repeat (20 copies)
MKKTLTLFAILLLVSFSLFATVSACNEHGPSITLSPPQGFAMTMISGTGFDNSKTISISYDGAVQTTVPEAIKTDSQGSFTAIISIPDELAVGVHTITTTESPHGDSASATFTVVDMKGPQGVQGIAGLNGKDGTNGIKGLDFNATGNVLVFNGTDGLNGKDGTNGINGINGVNGLNGKDGANGAQGPAGSQGLQGTIQPIIVTKPTPTNPLDFQSFLVMLMITLIAFTATMLTIYRKSNR